MPFELGLAVARDLDSSAQPTWFIFAKDLTLFKSSLSDLDGTDVQIHSGKRKILFTKLMNIFSSPSLEISVPLMETAYLSLLKSLPVVFEDAGQENGRETVFETVVFRKLCAIASAIESERTIATVLSAGRSLKKELPGAFGRRARSFI